MGDVTASMTHSRNPGQLASDTCLTTASENTETGAVTAGDQMVGKGNVSYVSHGSQQGRCPETSTSELNVQSSIGFEPMAPDNAVAGETFLLGQMSHQNWVIQLKDPGNKYLYGDLNLNIEKATGGDTSDSFAWNLEETLNAREPKDEDLYELDEDGNRQYWNRVDGELILSDTQAWQGQAPATRVARDKEGNMLFYHYYQATDGYMYPNTRRTYTTPDPLTRTQTNWWDWLYVVPDQSTAVDDITQFENVRSTKIVTNEGGMPYRLVIRGFTEPAEGETCSTTPEGKSVTQTFETEEDKVSYGCLYASWEQERPVSIEKEAQKAAATEAPAEIPSFTYTQDPAGMPGWENFTGLTPTAFQPATGAPTNTQDGVDRSPQTLLVPHDGLTVTEDQRLPEGWELTDVQCVQAPGTQLADGTYEVEPVEDWADRTRYPLVLNGDGSEVSVDPATGTVNLSNIDMADSLDTLGITCRYVNRFGPAPEPGFAVSKTVSEGQADPVVVGADGAFTVSYEVTVSNTGETSGTSAAVTDEPIVPEGMTVDEVTVDGNVVTAGADGLYPVSPGVELAPGETKSFTVVVSGTADVEGVDWTTVGECDTAGAGTPGAGLFNRVAMEGDSDGPDNNDACVPPSYTPPGEPGLSLVKMINGADAEADAPVVVEPGSDMDVSFEVTNTGETSLSDVSVSDDVVAADQIQVPEQKRTVDGEMVPFDGSLEPGEVVVFTATVPAPAAGEHHVNVATAEGTPPPGDGGDVPPSVTTPPDEGHADVPALEITKFINGEDANEAPGVAVEPGSDMEITYEVVNSGLVDLTDVRVDDRITTEGDKVVEGIECPATELAAGESMTCSVTIPAPVGVGEQHTNVAKAVGDVPPGDGGDVPPVESPEDPGNAHTPPGEPGLSLVKMINGADAEADAPVVVEPGSDMDVSFEVTNTGETSLSDVSVSDDVVAADQIQVPEQKRTVDGEMVPFDGSLEPGEVVVFTATVPAPAAGEHHVNVATAEGTPPPGDGGDVPPSVTTPPDEGHADVPGLEITKFINGEDANEAPGVAVEPGSDMEITYEVVNSGLVDLTDVRVDDRITTEGDKVVEGIECPATELAAGESMTCSVTIPAPVGVGEQHTNVAKAVGDVPPGDGGDVPPVESPEDPGNAHTPPGEPGLSLVKMINGADAEADAPVVVEPGSDMDVSFEVTNTGETSLSDVSVSDDVVAADQIQVPEQKRTVDGEMVPFDGSLEPGEVVVFTATVPAPAAGEHHVNVATAEGTPPPGDGGDVPPSVTTPPDEGHADVPALEITKFINGEDANEAPGVAVEPGSDMEITYEVVNSGLVDLTDVRVDDRITTEGDKVVEGIECPATELAAGESMTCSVTIPAPVGVGEQHTNVAKAVGDVPPGDGGDVPPVESPEDPGNAHTPPGEPGLSLVKMINGADAEADAPVVVEPGSDMDVSFEVTNTGETSLSDVSVSDDVVAADQIQVPEQKRTVDGEMVPFDGSLEPGEVVVFTATVPAPAAGEHHVNVATAEGTPPPGDGGDVPPSVTTPPDEGHADVPGLEITKFINGEDANEAPGVAVEPGSDMEITYEVVNSGLVDLTDVRVDDRITTEGDKVVEGIECPATELAAGESMTCSVTIPAPVGVGEQHTNVAKAVGDVPPGDGGDVPPVESPEDPGNAHTPPEGPAPEPTPEPTQPPAEPGQPKPGGPLPNTGGPALAILLGGLALTGAGMAVIRRRR
ncbi:DUF7507 domain-containing protein [Propioniferax innocua]|nr:choice-of-anchor K domain-containing protein [Propioniferax innocua]